MPPAPNDALEHFLTNYCTQKASPHYAVLIEGEWGSGKTWRIKEFANRFGTEHKKSILYVSLYGAKTINDIAEQFYRQLNPLLGHELVQTTWALARSALKGTLKIADDKVEVELSAPTMQKQLQTRNAILIFDDLERSSMPAEEVLGIINQLVEHDDHRVLILANAGKVPESDSGTPFATLKEKVIGRTLRINANPAGALRAFLNELGDMPGSQQLEKHRETVLRVFERSGYHNLRQLRQALLDFSQLRGALQQALPTLKLPDAFIERLVYEALALSIEHRAGQLTAGDLDDLCKTEAVLAPLATPTSSVLCAPRLRWHGLEDIAAYALPPALYSEFFQTGEIKADDVRQAIEHSTWFVSETKSDWLRLWHWQKLSNNDFDTLVGSLEQAYIKLEFSRPGEFLHATGLLLQFIRTKPEFTKEKILEIGTRTIKTKWTPQAAASGTLAPDEMAAVASDKAYGLAYWSRHNGTFQTLQTRIRAAVAASAQQTFEHWFEIWMTELKTDPKAWANRIAPHLGKPAMFADYPIPQHLHMNEFIQLLATGEMPMLREVMRALQVRYGHVSNHALIAEISFWEGVSRELESKKRKWDWNEGLTLSQQYLFDQLMPMIAAIAPKLEAIKKS